MESSNALLLNRVFTRNTLKQLLEDGESSAYSAAVNKYVQDCSCMTNRQCFSKIYHILKAQYPNEYFYKNTLLNKLLLGKHSTNTTTALTELPVGKSKADFILINGKAVVYEIKTPLDNFDRLKGQLADYYKAFSYVAVVTSEGHYAELESKLKESPVGIYILTSRGTISERKAPCEYTDSLSSKEMFRILRKEEYEKILLDEFGNLPQVSKFQYYRECSNLFDKLPLPLAHKKFVQILKHRSTIECEQYKAVPYELKFLVYFSNFRKNDYINLNHFLEQ